MESLDHVMWRLNAAIKKRDKLIRANNAHAAVDPAFALKVAEARSDGLDELFEKNMQQLYEHQLQRGMGWLVPVVVGIAAVMVPIALIVVSIVWYQINREERLREERSPFLASFRSATTGGGILLGAGVLIVGFLIYSDLRGEKLFKGVETRVGSAARKAKQFAAAPAAPQMVGRQRVRPGRPGRPVRPVIDVQPDAVYDY